MLFDNVIMLYNIYIVVYLGVVMKVVMVLLLLSLGCCRR